MLLTAGLAAVPTAPALEETCVDGTDVCAWAYGGSYGDGDCDADDGDFGGHYNRAGVGSGAYENGDRVTAYAETSCKGDPGHAESNRNEVRVSAQPVGVDADADWSETDYGFFGFCGMNADVANPVENVEADADCILYPPVVPPVLP